MLEQKTMQQGMGLIEKFGPIEGLLIYAALLTIGVVAWNIIQSRSLKRQAVDPSRENKREIEKLREARGEMLEKMHLMELQIQNKISREWAESKLIPKIEELGKDVAKLSSSLDSQTRIMAEALTRLSGSIERHDARINQLEKTG